MLWNIFLLSTFVEWQPVQNGGNLKSSGILTLAGFTSQSQAYCDSVSHALTQYARMRESSFFNDTGMISNGSGLGSLGI